MPPCFYVHGGGPPKGVLPPVGGTEAVFSQQKGVTYYV